MSEDIFELLDQIRELDEDYLEPVDDDYAEFQQLKTRFYGEIRELEGPVDPDEVTDMMYDREYDELEEYLADNLKVESDER